MDNYLGFGNTQSVDTEYKKNKNKRNSTHLALNSRYCNNKCRKCKKNMDPYVTGLIIRAQKLRTKCRKRKKNHEPVYNRVTNQKLRAKKTKFNALKFKTGTVTVNAANVNPKL